MNKSLVGKLALVTGGTGGIGVELCRRFLAEGATVIATYRTNPMRDPELAKNEKLISMPASVTDSEDLKKLAQKIELEFGKLDILVNNAGVSKYVEHSDLESLDDELIDTIFNTNWRGAFSCVRAFRHLLKKEHDGVVINISSIAGRTGVGSNIAYCASKAALDSMTITLARALAPEIRVLSISPGWVYGDYARKADPDYLAEQENKTPLKRIAHPEEVAEAALAAVTSLRFTTGAIIPVDGGRPLN